MSDHQRLDPMTGAMAEGDYERAALIALGKAGAERNDSLRQVHSAAAQTFATLHLASTVKEATAHQGVCPHGATGVCMYCILPYIDAASFAIQQAARNH